MEKVVVRKSISLQWQLIVLSGILLFGFAIYSALQWQERKERLDGILRYQQIGMENYGDALLEKYFLSYSGSTEAFQLKLNGLLKMQNAMLARQQDELGKAFVNSALQQAKLEGVSTTEAPKDRRFFDISTEIVDLVFDMHGLGYLSIQEKNQLLAVAYFKMGTNYFPLARDYLNLFLSATAMGNGLTGNSIILEEMLVRLYRWENQHEAALAGLKRIEKNAKEKGIAIENINLRIARTLVFTGKYDQALEVLQQRIHTLLSQSSTLGDEFVLSIFFLVELFDFRKDEEKAKYYLSLLQHRLENSVDNAGSLERLADFMASRDKKIAQQSKQNSTASAKNKDNLSNLYVFKNKLL